ncbi:transposase [Vibrio sp. JC009]|uniref:RNA-guided endonuclease InsQ/TnpB family protein n=1 Tax=Vibrio sp. JC009 TaxID=2912314 RepID=UPI0023B1193A|nr:transposase [Vibrio sp. JC009]WED22791.1 transposase [Vibrio sp. JC009]
MPDQYSSGMQISIKTQLFTNNRQATYMAKASGTARFVWNWALANWNEQYQQVKEGKRDKKPNGMSLKKEFNAIKKSDYPWVYEVTKYASQQPFIHLGRAWSEYFKGNRNRPKFKKKGRCRDAFYVGGDQVKVQGRFVKVPNLGWVRMAEQIKYGGHINSMTISRRADKWYVSFSINVEVSMLPCKSQAGVGVDLGIKALATLSRGEFRYWFSPKPLQQSLRKLARYQRRLAKKVKGSNGYKKLRMKIARLHKRIADIRSNTLHQLTCYLVKNFSDITIEDLNVKGMMSNGRLARHIADVGFYEFRRQLEYKCQNFMVRLNVADRWYPSSKRCSSCGRHNPNLTLSDRTYRCECGLEVCRDHNAAINLESYTAYVDSPVSTIPLHLFRINACLCSSSVWVANPGSLIFTRTALSSLVREL